jgi:oligogalacturonide lyase
MPGKEWTRRGFLASLAAGGAVGVQKKLPSYPSERERYLDPSTEFAVTRLTSPDHSSFLPPAGHRAVSRRGSFLIYTSDRTGSAQLMQMFSNTGESRQLTEAGSLDPSSPDLAPDDRSVLFFDGPVLKRLVLGGMRETEIYRDPEGWSRGTGLGICRDGSEVCLVETQEGRWRLRLAPLGSKGSDPVTAFEAPTPLSDPLPRPQHGGILYRDEEGMLALVEGGQRRRLPLAPGRTGSAYWSAGGESLLYLSFPVDRRPSAIREWVAASGADRLVASTSQYASFAPNANGTVFVGASANKASPYILLMLRITRRELALCEHRSSDVAAVSPVFSPDSQRVFFQSDRDGKPAIYMAEVQRLVERTEE